MKTIDKADGGSNRDPRFGALVDLLAGWKAFVDNTHLD
jgi:hypothetical protein